MVSPKRPHPLELKIKMSEEISYCCEDMERDVLWYVIAISGCPYEEDRTEVRDDIQEVREHLAVCSGCRKGYEGIRKLFERPEELEESQRELFSSERFETLKRNERFLEWKV